MTEQLQRQGYTVMAPADPLRGLSSDAAYIHSVLATISGPVILVGHSYGGAVVTNAAVGAANVKALVYVSAIIPDQGETSLGLTSKFPGSLIVPPGTPGATLSARPFPPFGQTDVDLYINPDNFRQIFAQDVSVAKATELAASQRPFALGALVEASGPPAWKTIPAWALVALPGTIP